MSHGTSCYVDRRRTELLYFLKCVTEGVGRQVSHVSSLVLVSGGNFIAAVSTRSDSHACMCVCYYYQLIRGPLCSSVLSVTWRR